MKKAPLLALQEPGWPLLRSTPRPSQPGTNSVASSCGRVRSRLRRSTLDTSWSGFVDHGER